MPVSGTEFLVNTVTQGSQYSPTITDLAGGGFVVSWNDLSGVGGDASNGAVKAQIFTADGIPVGGEILVNTVTDGYQFGVTITGLANGGFVASWADSPGSGGAEVEAQIFAADGSHVGGEFRVNTNTGGDQQGPTITGLVSGGFVVSWVDSSGPSNNRSDIKAQIFSADGSPVGSEFRVNTITVDGQTQPKITELVGGGFVVSWTHEIGFNSTDFDIKAQLFAADGSPVGGEFLVNTNTAAYQFSSTITGLTGGGFVISWGDNSGIGGDPSQVAIKAQIYAANGSPVGGEFLINTVTAGYQNMPTVAGLVGGGFVVSWVDSSGIGGDDSFEGIKAQVFTADGTRVGDEFLVNTTTFDSQDQPVVTGLASGEFVIAWRSTTDTNIYAQISGPETLFTSAEDVVNFNALSLGRQQIIDEGGSIYDALGGNDTVTLPDMAAYQLTPSVNWNPATVFHGGAGRDTITGGDGSDLIDGGDGSDIINGGSGNDVLIGSDDDDILIGGDGLDTFDFSSADFSGYAPNSVQSLHGDSHPSGGPLYRPTNPDLLKLPGKPEDYDITTTGTQVSIVHIQTGITFSVANIERVTFTQPGENIVTQNNLFLEMVRLSIDAYQPQGPLRNWHPLSAMELGLLSSGTEGSLSFTMKDGWYSAVDPTSKFEAVADAIVSIGMINGYRTLSIAFRGTDDPTDVSDWLDFPAHYAKFKPLIDAIDAFVRNGANEIEQVIVSGHSLGGAMVQEFMASHSGLLYIGLTIGSPGGDTANSSGGDPRIINFMHTDDIVTQAAIANVRDGGEIYINSDVSLVPFVSIGEHSKPLYLLNYLILLEFANDPLSPFSSSPLGISLALGQVYSGADVQIAVGRADSNDVNSSFQDHFVLAGANDDRIIWNSILPIGNRIVDGGTGTDAVVLSGSSLLWGWNAVGSHFDLSIGTIKVGELWRVEKLIFTFSIFETSVSLSQSQEGNSTKISTGDVNSLVPVVWLDGRQATVQAPNDGDVSLIVSTLADYVALGDRDISVTGSDIGDVIMLGTGVQTVAGGGGGDIINGVGSGVASVLQLFGQGGDDILIGGEGNDRLDGGDGADQLSGGAGSDTIVGGAEADLIVGGLGSDALTGGEGNDVFGDTKAGFNGDTIADFAVGDRIILTDATLSGFAFNLTGNLLTFTGGSLTLQGNFAGYQVVAGAASSGGVQLTLQPVLADVRNDFNGDGRSDILWRNVDGQLSNWLGQANGGFTPNNANAAAVVPTDWQIVGTGDFNGDGRDDILWRNTDGTLSNWLATPAGGYTANDANAAVVVPTDWHVVGTGDFNGDGLDDILWRNNDGTLSNWLGQANGGFVANDANAAAPVPTAWHVAGTGDFNGDGRDDIFWRNDDGQLSNWLGQANGGFTPNNANAAAVVPVAWAVIGTGDFNGDGRDDILWRHTDGTLSNWLGTAAGGYTPNDANAAVFVPLDWTVVATGDYDGDGRDDILWRHTDGTLSNWLGQANGGFVANDANAATPVPMVWEVHPEPFLL